VFGYLGIESAMDATIFRFDRYSLPQSQAPMAESPVWVEIKRGRVRQRIRKVCGPIFLIGTAPDCDLVLGDASFPDAYAYLLVQSDRVAVRRVGEGPVLFVNGEAIDIADVFAEDQLAFGPFELRMIIRERPQIVAAEWSQASMANGLWAAEFAEV